MVADDLFLDCREFNHVQFIQARSFRPATKKTVKRDLISGDYFAGMIQRSPEINNSSFTPTAPSTRLKGLIP